MLEFDIPGFRRLQIQHLVLDYNGTIAVDGILLNGVGNRIEELAEHLTVHVITADTFGEATKQVASLPLEVKILPSGDQARAKRSYVEALGVDSVVAVGNGRNDHEMLDVAAIGMALIQAEGGAAQTILNADVVVTSILNALDLLRFPKRLTATLRA